MKERTQFEFKGEEVKGRFGSSFAKIAVLKILNKLVLFHGDNSKKISVRIEEFLHQNLYEMNTRSIFHSLSYSCRYVDASVLPGRARESIRSS